MSPSTANESQALHPDLQDIDMAEFEDDADFDMVEQVDNKMAQVALRNDNPRFLLRTFYQRLFPYKTYYEWLNYDREPTRNFSHREFSFTLASDIYIRYNSFPNVEALQKEIERLQPVKIDIGAVYNVQPRDKKTVNDKVFRPLEKELVFDIDMTDYDDIRTCCSGGDICLKCWTFMTIAVKVIDAALKDDFGFEHMLWVYSGRRGVHCWVADARARVMENAARKAIVSYLEIIKGGSEMNRKVKLPYMLHPSLQRSLEIVKPYFVPLLLKDQAMLDEPENWNKVLAILSDTTIREALEEEWSKNPSRPGTEKWNDLRQALENSKQDKNLPRDILFQYTYPRLDDKVSTNINHLLKSPFCVHPKTQRVCVPFSADDCENFNPLQVPTLDQICAELDAFDQDKADEERRRLPDYKKTSLKPSIEIFEKFVNRLLLETQRAKRAQAETSMEF
ncbi:hypothetical protein BCR43DRAFT_461715 [Syncephalastrum racemosum]|uniref:DNA primase n=1 Tax=Syncephalastrum racemosum TaxID=13706 RepID=A0A1X2H6V6_SYNRA|nr:hypothetical protein BCR43DRAFT_461715 [Syncephalastrum racemosum]